MLFNSYVFIFGFLPIVFLGFYRIGRYSCSLASLWLAAASLFFYGWWDTRFVGLLLGSVVFNYGAAYLIGHGISRSADKLSKRAKLLLTGAIAANLLLLGYFKYANFFAANINQLTGATLPIGEVFLPLGISFFTFTQIAFLVDTYQGKVREYNFVHYILFVTYFPHLVAGPVLHHKEMMPQFASRSAYRINWDNVAVGLAIFVLGLAKKVLIADSLAEFATPVFDAVKMGGQPMLFEAWIGALAYTLQLYFDFSGYTDMAIGLSLMFNVRLPMNFNSPYKATSIIEFWRCWHMTLSRFLRDYLYIPLGGNRKGKTHRYLNLLVTMLLGGLWHGAGWTFIVWGGLHGLYLMVNHVWRSLKQRVTWGNGGRWAKLTAGACTFLAVVVAWVFFRADSISSAIAMLHGMAGMNGISLPERLGATSIFAVLKNYGVQAIGATPLSHLAFGQAVQLVTLGLFICFCLPNSRQIAWRFHPTLENDQDTERVLIERGSHLRGKLLNWMVWQPTKLQGTFYGGLFFLLLMYMASAGKSEFLYFQF